MLAHAPTPANCHFYQTAPPGCAPDGLVGAARAIVAEVRAQPAAARSCIDNFMSREIPSRH
jgi:hypothetical protein